MLQDEAKKHHRVEWLLWCFFCVMCCNPKMHFTNDRIRVKNILKAKRLGYFIELHYIGVESVQIAKKRVKYRVEQGGHGIPEKDIEKRYIETFQQLNHILKECNLIAFYDNTENFRRFAICKNGELVRISQKVPKWFSNIESLNLKRQDR